MLYGDTWCNCDFSYMWHLSCIFVYCSTYTCLCLFIQIFNCLPWYAYNFLRLAFWMFKIFMHSWKKANTTKFCFQNHFLLWLNICFFLCLCPFATVCELAFLIFVSRKKNIVVTQSKKLKNIEWIGIFLLEVNVFHIK